MHYIWQTDQSCLQELIVILINIVKYELPDGHDNGEESEEEDWDKQNEEKVTV